MPAFVEATIARVRVANLYTGAYFNGFIKAGISQDIRKTKNSYGLTGINQMFKRFERLSISVDTNLMKKLAKSKGF